MSGVVKNPEQLYQIMSNLYGKMTRVPDFYKGHPENFIELSHPFYRMTRMTFEFDQEMRHDLESNTVVWRGQFKVKLVHNIVKDYLIEGPDLAPQDFIQEPQYIAFRYMRMNGRVAYLDWEHNPKTWI